MRKVGYIQTLAAELASDQEFAHHNYPQQALRRWRDEVVSGTIAGPPAIAAREGCSPRRVTMLISLAFLSPDLVKQRSTGGSPAAGMSRLVDPPLACPERDRAQQDRSGFDLDAALENVARRRNQDLSSGA
jgi:hypothetical protein